MTKLTYEKRKKLAEKHPEDFVYPPSIEYPLGQYPIEDIRHGRNALARASAFGTREQQVRVGRAVHKRYPQITCMVPGCQTPAAHNHGAHTCCGEPMHCAEVLRHEQHNSRLPDFGGTAAEWWEGV